MNKRVVIGGVQIGIDYGVANNSGKMDSNSLDSLANYMSEFGICEFDTASSYGESEALIGKYFIQRANFLNTKVVTKFTLDKHYALGDIERLVKISLNNLQDKTLFGLLVHRFNDYKSYPELMNELLNLRLQGLIENIGFSIYSTEELDIILENKLDINIIQIPFNIFDKRFERYFDEVASRNIKIYARSIFMQGLVFLDLNQINQNLFVASKYLKFLKNISDNYGFSIPSICFNYVFLNSKIDKLIIGIDNPLHLKKIIQTVNDFDKSHNIFNELDEFKTKKDDLYLIMSELSKVQLERQDRKK
jgi:aryl-alcohol dehydrogenase-like predicted oxidoreductase